MLKEMVAMYYIYDLYKKRQYSATLGEKFDTEDQAWDRIYQFYNCFICLEPRKWRKGMADYAKG